MMLTLHAKEQAVSIGVEVIDQGFTGASEFKNQPFQLLVESDAFCLVGYMSEDNLVGLRRKIDTALSLRDRSEIERTL